MKWLDDITNLGSLALTSPSEKTVTSVLPAGATSLPVPSNIFSGGTVGVQTPRRGSVEIIEAYRTMPGLRTITQKIAMTFASVPWSVYRVKDTRSGKSVKHLRLQQTPVNDRRGVIKSLQDMTMEELLDDPVCQILARGNDCLSGFEVRQVMQVHLDLVGEAFAWIERNLFGMPVALWPMNPSWVMDTPALNADPVYSLRIGGKTVDLPASEMFYIKDPDPASPYGRGAGLGMSLGDELDSDEYAALFIKSFFANDANPTAVWAFENLTTPQLKRLESDIDNKHRGAERAHKIHLISPKPDIETFSPSFQDMTMVEVRRFLRNITRETFGVPPEIVGIIENSNRATIEAANFIFAQWVLTPRLEQWRIALQKQIVPQFDDRKVLHYENPVPEDKEHILNIAAAAPNMRTRGEWREMQSLPPNEGDNVYIQPFGVEQIPAETGKSSLASMMMGAPPPEASKGFVGKSITMQDISPLLNALDSEAIASKLDWWKEAIESVANRTLADDIGVSVSMNILDPRIVEHLRNLGKVRIKGINKTSEKRLRNALEEGVKEGESIDALSSRIRREFQQIGAHRAEVIARTEVLRSSNFAIAEAQRQSGVVHKRVWVSTLDNRTRDLHKPPMHGQVRLLDDPFLFADGVTTMHPGASGVAEHDIQCRCTTSAVIDDDDQEFITWLEDIRQRGSDTHIAEYKKFDERITPWEKRAEQSITAGFEEQMKAMLAKLFEIAALSGR